MRRGLHVIGVAVVLVEEEFVGGVGGAEAGEGSLNMSEGGLRARVEAGIEAEERVGRGTAEVDVHEVGAE